MVRCTLGAVSELIGDDDSLEVGLFDTSGPGMLHVEGSFRRDP
jgi:hypothetical protein